MILAVLDDSPAALDVLAFTQSLGQQVEAATFAAFDNGDTGDPDDLAKRGVRTLHRITHPELADCAPAASGDALAQLIEHLRPDGVVAVSSDTVTEAMAHVAALTGLPLATNCVEVSTGEPWLLTRVRGGGMLLEEAELDVGSAGPALLTIAQGVSGDIGAGPVESCEVREFTPELAATTTQARVVERASRGSGMTLATAPVIVSGGRGVGSAEGYRVLEELAERLGGVVGCSRVATNNGWRPHSDQVGLTGTKVTPELYLACGISGATQHWVGCMDSKVIMAVNTDPEAPLVRRATYAVIGDVHEVLPAIIEELNARSRT